jgi:hypothetical protein
MATTPWDAVVDRKRLPVLALDDDDSAFDDNMSNASVLIPG